MGEKSFIFFQGQFRHSQRSACFRCVGRRNVSCDFCFQKILIGNDVPLMKRLLVLQRHIGQTQLCFCALQLGASPFDKQFFFGRAELKQQGSLLNGLTGKEVDLSSNPSKLGAISTVRAETTVPWNSMEPLPGLLCAAAGGTNALPSAVIRASTTAAAKKCVVLVTPVTATSSV